MEKISRTCASVTLRVRWPTCRRVLPSSGAGGGAFFSSVSIGRGLSPPEAGAGRSSRRARGDGERPREGEEEPLERLVLVLELVPLELEEPPLREELPLLDEDREAAMALGSHSGRPATKQIDCGGVCCQGSVAIEANEAIEGWLHQATVLLARCKLHECRHTPFKRARRKSTSPRAVKCGWRALASLHARIAWQAGYDADQ